MVGALRDPCLLPMVSLLDCQVRESYQHCCCNFLCHFLCDFCCSFYCCFICSCVCDTIAWYSFASCFLLLFVGIGVTKSDLSDETAQLLFNAAIQLLAKPTRFRFVEKMVSNIYSAEECAIAVKRGEKEYRKRSLMGMSSASSPQSNKTHHPLSADDDIYL